MVRRGFHNSQRISTIKVVKNKLGRRTIWHRYAFLSAAGLALLAALSAGAQLLGVLPNGVPVPTVTGVNHGPLMIFGFLGGAIGLERTVAARTRWAWAGPAFHVIGVATLLFGAPQLISGLAFSASFIVLGAIYALIYRRQPVLSVIAQAAGVVPAVSASFLWAMGEPFAAFFPLAVVYVVATIIGERIELARISFATSGAEALITAHLLFLVAAGLVFVVADSPGFVLIAVGLITVAATTARVDVAKNLIRASGLPRYSAACMLAGYIWLVVAGLSWVAFGHEDTGYSYDITIHTVFLGFVMSMIFAHAPIIVTSVLRVSLPYHPAMYVPVIALHLGLLTRVTGAVGQNQVIYQIGGVINIAAVLLFILTAVVSAVASSSASAAKSTAKSAAARPSAQGRR